MKKILISILVLAVTSTAAFAGGHEGRQGGDRMARMQEHLGLSDEQVAQIREIREKGGGREEMRAVFTDEQRKLMQERRAQMKARGEKGHAGTGHGQRGKGHPPVPDQQAGPEQDEDPDSG